ncbi:MAG: hypothetical protein ABIQ41_13015 [Gemmatimonadales bacterium]
MQAEYYKNSLAVFGNTKPWKENIKQLGGSFNGNLAGRPGWVFKKELEPIVMQFIANANAGYIQPIAPAAPTPVAQPQMVPFGQVAPALTPQDAMARLTMQQPQMPVTMPQVPTPQQPQMPVMMPQVPTPQPARLLTPLPQLVKFPNVFVAADGVVYQMIMYVVPVPQVGQTVTLSMGTGDARVGAVYKVEEILSSLEQIDDILIKREAVEEGEEDQVSRAVIMAGKWQIPGLGAEHSLTFSAPQ